MAFATDPSEREKIDTILRLPGLKFPKDELVLGKKNIDLMMALGAIDTKRHCAGKQIYVVRRLCVLYQAILAVYRDGPIRDINHERFYEAALLSIPDEYRAMAKYLTPESLRTVIEIYRKAFVRSGWKVIKKVDEELIRAEWRGLVKGDFDLPDRSSGKVPAAGETLLESIEGTSEETTEILEPIEPIGDRVKLEKLVKQWMVIRARDRSKITPDAPEIEDPVFPQQKPDESAHAYMLRVKNAFRELREDNDDLEHVNSKYSDRYSKLYDKYSDMEDAIDEKNRQIEEKDRRIDELEQQLGADGDH